MTRSASLAAMMAKVAKNPVTGCWLWNGGRCKGYGVCRVLIDGKVEQRAHRAIYRLTSGSIPDGMHLDHLCLVKHCVNPDHLEPVTPGENVRRAVRGQGGKRTIAVRYENPRTYREFASNKRAEWEEQRARHTDAA